MENYLSQAEALLDQVRGKFLTRAENTEKTFALAKLLLELSISLKTEKEEKREAWLARMMNDPKGRLFLTAMTDECFRSSSPKRTAEQLAYLIKKFGIPDFFNETERVKFLVFRLFGPLFPHFFIPQVRKNLRQEMAQVLLPEDAMAQSAYFKASKEAHVRINLNHLGEAILGEEEAERRLHTYLSDLANPLIEYISIKISTLFSQINMVGFEESLEVLASKLRLLYRAAMSNRFQRTDKTSVAKFVNLDMEEYRDLHLTVALFQKVLGEPEFHNYQAGIVLQSYLPDSFPLQKELTSWAQRRVQQGGAPIKIRIVKGANLAMERVESSLRIWPQAPFEKKVETDANFKRMIEFAAVKEHAEAVHIGIGSHNLFDIAYTFLLRAENKTEPFISFEMLEGMATPMRRAVKQLAGEILLYCPEAKQKDFQNAVAYLIRRLDENSGEENFLRHLFEMRPNNPAWENECSKFRAACALIDSLSEQPRRNQNREIPLPPPKPEKVFENEPDTDFSLRENRAWANSIFSAWENKIHPNIPLVIAGEEVESLLAPGIDPSRPEKPLYHYSLADVPLVEKAIQCAENSGSLWGDLPFEKRSDILAHVAEVFRKRRKDFIGAMIADGGKTVQEADPEVSEAVDFLEYYRRLWSEQLNTRGVHWNPKGIVLVVPPWNFPCSLPVGGIAAALTAGNSVLFKPAPEAVLVGWHVVQAFWEGGVPKKVLQFINCKEEPIGSYLIKHPKIASVVLTGGTSTALKFMKMRPGIDLHAETGGKNAMIVTAMSDRDLAIKDILSSAFGHAGQKCSACSLLILEKEVYNDPNFKKQLVDGAKSLTAASAWSKKAKVTPMIRPPVDPLLQGLTTLDADESWALQPKKDAHNPHLWSPGIKWGVKEGSFMHQTELFGPLLGVMCAEDLEEAIRFANGTPYGLTSGLHSLDEREQEIWKRKIVAGNLYINRGITGAIVRRQPFGGAKASSFGSGAKAGGPNYVAQLATPIQSALPSEKAALPPALLPVITSLEAFQLSGQEIEIWKRSAESYAYWCPLLKTPKDPQSLLGEDNFFYHVSRDKVAIRYEENTPILPLLQSLAACMIAETPLEISSSLPLHKLAHLEGVSFYVEQELEIFSRKPNRIRLLSLPSNLFKQRAAEEGVILDSAPVLGHGQFELLHYLREVVLSVDYHRYGYLGLRDPQIVAKAQRL